MVAVSGDLEFGFRDITMLEHNGHASQNIMQRSATFVSLARGILGQSYLDLSLHVNF
jgi:hypothetical protein